MAYSPTELKKGVVIELDGKPYKIVDYNQKVVGRGGSIVNVRIKNLIDGNVLSKTFKGQDSIQSAEVLNQTVQYLYSDSSDYFFMDPTTFEQFQLSGDLTEDVADYLKEGDEVTLQTFNERIVGIVLPKNVDLRVVECDMVVKGDTTSSVLKDVTTETGLVVKVPAFIKVDDVISVDTETGAYRERKKG
jgi:elongation factor P